MKIDRNLADAVYRTDFGAFTYAAYKALNPGQRLIPNWHIETICHQLQQMVSGEARPRLVLNQPPRTLKSFIVSVSFPSWLLGRDPSCRIICASYSDELTTKFSRDCRALLDTRSSSGCFLKPGSIQRRHLKANLKPQSGVLASPLRSAAR
jgi:hypothetical protein